METSLELFKTVLMTRDPRTRPLYFRLAWRREHNVLGQMTIHILPDDVLLEIFKVEYLLKPVVRRVRETSSPSSSFAIAYVKSTSRMLLVSLGNKSGK